MPNYTIVLFVWKPLYKELIGAIHMII